MAGTMLGAGGRDMHDPYQMLMELVVQWEEK